jgi:regulatory protein
VLRKRPRKRALGPGQSSDTQAAGNAAVVLLSRRDFCSQELAGKLNAQGYEPETVQGVIHDLLERGYLNDERYVLQFVAMHAARGHGPLRIQRELSQLGLDAGLIDSAVAGGEDWAQRARELRIRRFGLAQPVGWPAKAKQARFLQYRGFSNDHIRAALDSEVSDDLS